MLPTPERPCADCGKTVRAKHARYCPDCRWKYQRKPPKYATWTPERDAILRDRYAPEVKGRAAEIAAMLRIPRWKVNRRAAELGLARPVENRRAWTPEEDQILWAHAGTRHVNWIAKRLGRSIASVTLRLKRLRLSRRCREGYTLRELCLCFGTDHHVIERWVREGKLCARMSGVAAGARERWAVTDADLLRFIQAHPMAFELRKVDQVWFLDLILDGALVRRALGVLEREEAEVAA